MFFRTHIFLHLPEEAICGDKALKARAPYGGCAARPGGLCAVALGCTWLRPPAGTAFCFLASYSRRGVLVGVILELELNLGACLFESAASGLPPEGLRKKSFLEILDFFLLMF